MNGGRNAPSPEALTEVQQLLMRGGFAKARAAAEKLAEDFPGHPRVQNLLGLSLMQMGHAEPALSAFARANAADPKFAGAFVNRANLLVALGRFREAASMCANALAADPTPENLAKASHLLGVSRANMGDAKGAVEAFRSAITAGSDMPASHAGLGGALAVLGRFEEALTVLEPAAHRWPEDVGIARNLGNALIEVEQFDLAVEVLQEAVARHTEDGALYLTLARALRGFGRVEAGLAAAEKAVAAMPNHAEAHGLVGSLRRELGDREGAIAAYDAALKITPNDPTALVARWRVTPPPPGDPVRDRIGALLDSPETAPQSRAALELLLFDADDKAGDTASAFSHLMRSCAAKRSARPYDIEAQARMFAAIRAAFADGITPLSDTVSQGPRPVFIVGMPRSGTTLVEQILASHPDVFGGGELPVLGRAMAEAGWGAGHIGASPAPGMLAKLRETYLGAIARLGSDAVVITDKTPMNFRWLGFALAAMPEARALVMKRDARATCFSNLTHDLAGSANDFGTDMEDTAEMYRLHLDLVALWKELFPNRVATVPYEQLTENQEQESRALVAAVGLDWDPACLAFHQTSRGVRTSSLEQVRRPMYRGSSEAWRRYEAYLGPMLERLEGL